MVSEILTDAECKSFLIDGKGVYKQMIVYFKKDGTERALQTKPVPEDKFQKERHQDELRNLIIRFLEVRPNSKFERMKINGEII